MRSDLVQLLRDRSVVPLSRIITSTLEGRELRVRTVGAAWWQDGVDRDHDHELEFVFGGVGDGVLEVYLKIDDFLGAHGAFRSATKYLNCPSYTGLLSSQSHRTVPRLGPL